MSGLHDRASLQQQWILSCRSAQNRNFIAVQCDRFEDEQPVLHALGIAFGSKRQLQAEASFIQIVRRLDF